MTENALLQWCDAQDRLIAFLLDELVDEGDPTAQFRRVEKTLPFLIEICGIGQQALNNLRTAQHMGRIKKTQVIGMMTWEYLPRTISTLERFKKECRQVQDAVTPLDHYQEFEESLAQFRKAAMDFLAKWPWANYARIAESTAAYERGEYKEAREALGELLHKSTPDAD